MRRGREPERASAPRDAPGKAGVAYIVGVALASGRLRGPAFGVAGAVLHYFFLAQYLARLPPRRRPLVEVGHPLDELVPFRPEKVAVYLGFVGAWVTAISHTRRELGKSSEDALADFLREIAGCYREAHGVYRRCLSTTRRPARPENAGFLLIHALDPHLFCLPSLHVMLACESFLGMRAVYAKLGRLADAAIPGAEVRARAARIVDSVLYVKQHSLNCVAAALYMTSITRRDFGREEARAFVAELFAEPDLAGVRPRLAAALLELYGRFMDEGEASKGDYRDVLVRFLLDRRPSPPETPPEPLEAPPATERRDT